MFQLIAEVRPILEGDKVVFAKLLRIIQYESCRLKDMSLELKTSDYTLKSTVVNKPMEAFFKGVREAVQRQLVQFQQVQKVIEAARMATKHKEHQREKVQKLITQIQNYDKRDNKTKKRTQELESQLSSLVGDYRANREERINQIMGSILGSKASMAAREVEKLARVGDLLKEEAPQKVRAPGRSTLK